MLRLALAAITLMVVVPSLGRLAGSGPATAGAHAMHAGKHGGHGAHGNHGKHGTPPAPAAPQPAGGAQHDCSYCPLLASMVPPAPATAALFHGTPAARASVGAARPRLAWRHPSGLGSRGPPAT